MLKVGLFQGVVLKLGSLEGSTLQYNYSKVPLLDFEVKIGDGLIVKVGLLSREYISCSQLNN